jgi:hypothetical protein
VPRVDEHFFRPDGDYEVLGGKQTLRSFIVEWKEHYAKVHRPGLFEARLTLRRSYATL